MSKNVKIGGVTYTGVSSVSLEDATTSGTYDYFVDTTDANATSGDILSSKTGYVNGTKVTGNIQTKTSSDLTTSGATVNVPSGYYASQASMSVTSGSATTPTTTITTNPTVTGSVSGSNYVVTASVSASQSVTPTIVSGYVTSGTAGTISASGSATMNITIYDGTVVSS